MPLGRHAVPARRARGPRPPPLQSTRLEAGATLPANRVRRNRSVARLRVAVAYGRPVGAGLDGVEPDAAGGSNDSMSAAAPASSTGPFTVWAMTPLGSMKNCVGRA